jgi:hypothetical protein
MTHITGTWMLLTKYELIFTHRNLVRMGKSIRTDLKRKKNDFEREV